MKKRYAHLHAVVQQDVGETKTIEWLVSQLIKAPGDSTACCLSKYVNGSKPQKYNCPKSSVSLGEDFIDFWQLSLLLKEMMSDDMREKAYEL